MGFEESKTAIARIYTAEFNQIVGTGFLVSEYYLLTCAHVVDCYFSSYLEITTAQICLDFPFIDPTQRYYAELKWSYKSEIEPGVFNEDFALLRLNQLPNPEIVPIKLNFLQDYLDSAVIAFGFPRGDKLGRNLTAITRGGIVGKLIQIQGIQTTEIGVEPGFSGAPVWCRDTKTWIGMLISRDRRRTDAKIGFMIPSQELRTIFQMLSKLTLQNISRAFSDRTYK